jgi:hypothetical protein
MTSLNQQPQNPSTDPLDLLTPEEVTAFKIAAANKSATANKAGFVAPPLNVAEGDSWFDFILGTDVIDCLRDRHGYQIQNFARAGDTLENMILGNIVDANGKSVPAGIQQVLLTIKQVKPRLLFFSGGGNDVVGEKLVTYLNHHDFDPNHPLQEAYVKYMFNEVFHGYLSILIKKVSEANPGTMIVMHGYGRPIPNGQGAGFWGLSFVGPWMLPALMQKHIPKDKHRELINRLIDEYNAMLAKLASEHPKQFVYVDLRSVISDSDWRDELHLNNSAFARVADEIHRVIDKRLQDSTKHK